MRFSIHGNTLLLSRNAVPFVRKRLCAAWRPVGVFLLVSALAVGCGDDDGSTAGPDSGSLEDATTGDGGPDDDGALPDASPGPQVCAAGAEGLECLFKSHAEVAASCDPEALQALRESLEARHGWLPAWHDGEALFVTYNDSAAVAGEFNGWDPEAVSTAQLCGSEIYTVLVPVTSGRWPYKLVAYDLWVLDPCATTTTLGPTTTSWRGEIGPGGFCPTSLRRLEPNPPLRPRTRRVALKRKREGRRGVSLPARPLEGSFDDPFQEGEGHEAKERLSEARLSPEGVSEGGLRVGG